MVSDTGMPLLLLQGCTMEFGGLTAVKGLDFDIGSDALVGLIGPNGAGKTTVFNLITGIYEPTAGRVLFSGENVCGLKPYQITGRGIARTFQNIRLFPSLTVYETVQAALRHKANYGLVQAVIRPRRFYDQETAIHRDILEILEFFDLAALKDEPATSLPYGLQRRVEIVRALATGPKLLLLDEPAAGMNPSEKNDLMKLIKTIKSRFSCSIFLIEHDMKVVMGVCDRVSVLDYGVKIAEGAPKEIQCNPQVIEAYLGVPN